MIESWLPGIDISVIGLLSQILDDRLFIQLLLSRFRGGDVKTLVSLIFASISLAGMISLTNHTDRELPLHIRI